MKRSLSIALFWGLLLIVLGAAQHQFLSDSQGSLRHLEVINGDGRGYYDYLTSIFIDHDLSEQPVNGRYLLDVDGDGVNKYFSGTALLMLPFFLLGMLAAWAGSYPLDGISLPFQLSMVLSALSYVLIGVCFLRRLMASFQISPWVRDLVALTVVFGTNMLYYAAFDLTASHVYSFAAVAAWCYYARLAWITLDRRAFLLAAVCLSITVLIRPVNGLVIFFLPFLSGTKSALISGWHHWRSKTSSILLAAVIGVCIVGIQLIMYRIQSGSWVIWSYADEGFYFFDPSMIDFLFSFKRGWFVYAPFMLLLLPAWWVVGRKSAWLAAVHIISFLLVVYILSSWWSWHYGGSYGARPMVDFTAPVVMMIALGINPMQKWWARALVVVVAAACVWLAIAQVTQLKYEIISAWHMNADKWWWSLGKQDPIYAEQLGGRNDVAPYHHESSILFEGHPFDQTPHWSVRAAKPSPAGDKRILLNRNIEFNPSFHYRFKDPSKVYIDLSLERYEIDSNAATSAFVVIELKDSTEQLRLYDAFLINDRPDLPKATWKQWEYHYALHESVERGDRLNIYLWNKGKLHFLVRDLKLKLHAMH